jgi:hypothetical protein
MRQVKTETLLRTIVLDYDESKTESDYEKALLKAYVDIHDKIAALKNRRGKLAYEYGLHEDQIEQGEKALAPVAAGISNFLQEVEVIAEKIKSDEAMTSLNVRMTEFHEEFIDPFQKAHIEPLAETCKALHEEYKAFEDAVDQMGEEFDKYHTETYGLLYKNYNDYALDLCAYDDDEQELRGELDKLQFYNEHDKIIDRYNALMAAARAAYAQWDLVGHKRNEYYDDSGLLDNSLSVSCAENKIGALHQIDDSLGLISRLIISEYSLTNGTMVDSFKNQKHIDDLPTHHTGIHTHITDAETGEDIEGAILSMPEAGKSSTSDLDGNADILKVKVKKYHVNVTCPNYQSESFKVKMVRGKILSFQIKLSKTAGGGGVTATREGNVTSPGIATIDTEGINPTPLTQIVIMVTGSALRFYASALINGVPGPSDPFIDVLPGTSYQKLLTEFAALLGMNDTKKYLTVQNIGATPGHYTITFDHLEA